MPGDAVAVLGLSARKHLRKLDPQDKGGLVEVGQERGSSVGEG